MEKKFIEAFLIGSLEEIERECKKIEVDIKDDKGNFRNTYDVLKDLSYFFTK